MTLPHLSTGVRCATDTEKCTPLFECGVELDGLGRMGSGFPLEVFGRGKSGVTGLRRPMGLRIAALGISSAVFGGLRMVNLGHE